jgi:hypothetical protein
MNSANSKYYYEILSTFDIDFTFFWTKNNNKRIKKKLKTKLCKNKNSEENFFNLNYLQDWFNNEGKKRQREFVMGHRIPTQLLWQVAFIKSISVFLVFDGKWEVSGNGPEEQTFRRKQQRRRLRALRCLISLCSQFFLPFSSEKCLGCDKENENI